MNASSWRTVRGPIGAVLGAWFLACSAGWAFAVAVAVYALDRSGAGAVGVVTAARLLPAILAAPLSGALVDRLGRGRVVTGACAVQAGCLGAVAWLMVDHASLPGIVALAVLSGAAATAPRPALEALMPALAVSPQQLIRATAAWGAIDNAGFLLGGGAGGVAIAALGAGTVTAVAAGFFALAAMLALSLPPVVATEPDEPEDELSSFRSAFAGVRAVARTPMLRAAFLVFGAALVLEGAIEVQLVVLAIRKLGMGNGGPGELYIVWAVGGLLGSAVLLALVRRRGYGLALIAGSVGLAAGIAVAGLDGVVLALIAMLPAGIGFALIETAIMAVVPRLADDAIAGRVYALSEILYAGAAGLGALLAPTLIASLGIVGSLAGVGGVFGIVALLAQPALVQLDARQQIAGQVRELLRGVSFLAPLPLPRLERLVRAARPVTLPAGADVVRAGEPGSEFFVIADGVVDIVEYGLQQEPGTGFGEIALLRDVARTATVRAATDVQLWALTRESFLSAVSAHADAARLADAMVAERLARPRVSGPASAASAGGDPSASL